MSAQKITLKVLVEALAVIRAVRALKTSDVVPVKVLVAAGLAEMDLGYHVDRILAAQQVEVAA